MVNLTQSQNLFEVFEKITSAFENKIAYRFLLTDYSSEEVSYADFYKKICSVADFLQRCLDIKMMDRVIILYPPGLNYLYSFYGCLLLGAIPVPAYPPDYRNTDRIAAIVKDCRPALILADKQIEAQLQTLSQSDNNFFSLIPKIASVPDEQLISGASYLAPNLNKQSVAFLQYTSGSTAAPKGVVVSHGNLLSNCDAIANALGSTAGTEMVSWLPPYHDMGLIGSILHPFTVGMTTTLMSPMFFIKRPVRWLKAIAEQTLSEHILSTAPNFGYQLCVDKIDMHDMAGINLTKWKLALCGAEPIRLDTYERFCEKFEVNGFGRSSFVPVYGLAEATLMVSGGVTAQAPNIVYLDSVLLKDGLAIPVDESKYIDTATPLMGCGKVVKEHTVVIVDPNTMRVCENGSVGEIWVSGESVATKYWNNPDGSSRDFQHIDNKKETFFRTGDMGFFFKDELYISGRLKDCLIINGRNHFPQDIENTISSSNPCLRRDCTAVFTVNESPREVIVAVQEVVRSSYDDAFFKQIILDVRKSVYEKHQLAIEHVVLIKQASIPKTSSGKIQRGQAKKMFIEKKLDVLAKS